MRCASVTAKVFAMTTALVNRAITTNTPRIIPSTPKPCMKSPAASSSASSTPRTVMPSAAEAEAASATAAGSSPSGTVASQVSVVVPAVGPSRAAALTSWSIRRGVPPKTAPAGSAAMPETVSVRSASCAGSPPAAGPEPSTVIGSPTPASRASAAERESTISDSVPAAEPSSRASSWPGGSIVASKKPSPLVELASR